ncbi:MAG: helix-turn-helix domain-containing protein [Gemmatimonadetes bacterium]|nr:helix-turn-helix domain-containing protein [Gemmatimonadota bacterium]
MLDDPRSVRSALTPLRRRLLAELREPDSASGLAPRLEISRQKLNYHLRQLEAQGLVELVEERRRRGFTERVFRTTAHALVVDPEVLGGLVDPEAIQDRFSSAYMVAAASRLVSDVAALRSGAAEAGKRLATITHESEIDFASPRELRAFSDELTGLLRGLIAKYHRPDVEESRSYRLLVATHPRREPEGGATGEEEQPETES